MTTSNSRSLLMVAARILLVVTTGFIIYEATIRLPVTIKVTNGDKILHTLAFGTLAFLADFSFPGKGFGWQKIVPLAMYGILIEFVQSFLPYRSAELMDFLVDCSGMIGYALCIPLLKQLPLFCLRWQNS